MLTDQQQWANFVAKHSGKASAKDMLVDLHDFGLLKVTGVDNAKFLQGQITCDIHKTSPVTMRGAHCNPQGRIICLFDLFKRGEDYYLLLPQSTLQITLNTLKKYAVFFKVELEISNDLFIVGLTGPLPLLETFSELTVLPIDQSRSLIIGEFQLLAAFWQHHIKNYATKDICHWKILDIRQKRVQIYDKTSAKLLPHEILLHQTAAIDFDKGCYTGQEIIARMHYKAKLKKGMYRAIMHKRAPQLGEQIYVSGSTEPLIAGIVIDSCAQGDDNYEALIVIENVYTQDHDLFLADAEQYYFSKTDGLA